MGMVFAAEGLDGPEKLLLLGYTNWTDPHGYCWPSEQRLADVCGTSRATVQRGKRKLVRRGLIKSVRRVNPRTGDPISNLTRVNLPLLASMARKAKAYDDDMINAITFDDDTQETPSDLLTVQSDSGCESNRLRPPVNLTPTPGQSDSQSLIDPEGIPHLSGDPSVSAEVTNEREEGAARGEDKPTVVSAPSSAAGRGPSGTAGEPSGDVVQVLAAYEEAAGGPALPGVRVRLLADATELLTVRPLWWVLDRARELPKYGTSLARHAEMSKVPFAAQAAAVTLTRAELIAACADCDGYGNYDGTDGRVGVCRHPRVDRAALVAARTALAAA